jgi:hypothetical protein
MQRRPGHKRQRSLQGIKAVVERQGRVPAEGDHVLRLVSLLAIEENGTMISCMHAGRIALPADHRLEALRAARAAIPTTDRGQVKV